MIFGTLQYFKMGIFLYVIMHAYCDILNYESVPTQDKALEVQDPSTSNGGWLDGAVGVFCDMFHIG